MPVELENRYWEIIDRQKEIINRKEQLKLKKSKITVIGCGGIGGAAVEMLARMGVGNLKIVDKDSFDLSNINRQLMSSLESVGQPKAKVAADILGSINPILKIEAIDQEVNPQNVQKILEGSHLVVDALDNLISRVFISRCAFELNIPFIHGAIHGTMGQITTFTNETPSYEELFKLPSLKKDLTQEILIELGRLSRNAPPVIGPVPNIVGCLQAFEGMKFLTGKDNLILAPQVLMFDLLKKEPFYSVKY